MCIRDIAKSLVEVSSSLFMTGFLDLKNIILYWQFISFLVILQSMEVLIYSPNFYLHIQDAMIFIQYCVDGVIEIASRIKL